MRCTGAAAAEILHLAARAFAGAAERVASSPPISGVPSTASAAASKPLMPFPADSTPSPSTASWSTASHLDRDQREEDERQRHGEIAGHQVDPTAGLSG